MGHLIIYCNGLIVAARGWTAETRRLCERCFAHRYYLSCGNRASILRRVSCVACRLSSFCIRLHAGGSRPRSDFFVRCPAQKEYKATASFSPAEIKHMIGLPERLVGSFSVIAGNRNADAMPTSRLAFVENCIGSWLTERKCRGNGRSAGGGASAARHAAIIALELRLFGSLVAGERRTIAGRREPSFTILGECGHRGWS